MRWIFLIAGGLATAAMLAISMRLNFLFGFSLGQTPERAWIFGCVSVISDAWKGLGPILILALLRERRWPAALGAASIWSVCFVYSVSSALGAAMEDRSARTGNRETLQLTYGETQAEISRIEQKRKGLREHRSASEIEAAINTLLARSMVSNQRVRGSIASLSHGCQRADGRTVEACAEISRMREELAAAHEERELDGRLGELSRQAHQLRERGAARPADPQAELLARVSRGWLAAGDIGPSLSLLLAVMIELISAFGPAVLSAYAETARLPRGAGENKSPGFVIDYLAERVQPAGSRDVLPARDLYADYAAWCLTHKRLALLLPAFVVALDHARAENGLGKIRKRKDCYYGIRIGASRRESLQRQ